MGRELKRVPLDFDWEIGKLWKGYINPNQLQECNNCDGLGWSQDYNRLKELWYGVSQNYKPSELGKAKESNESDLIELYGQRMNAINEVSVIIQEEISKPK